MKHHYNREHTPMTSGTPLHHKPLGSIANPNRMEFMYFKYYFIYIIFVVVPKQEPEDKAPGNLLNVKLLLNYK